MAIAMHFGIVKSPLVIDHMIPPFPSYLFLVLLLLKLYISIKLDLKKVCIGLEQAIFTLKRIHRLRK